ARGLHIAQRALPLPAVHFRNLPEVRCVTLAGIPGKLVKDSPAGAVQRRAAPRLREAQIVQRLVGEKRNTGRGIRAAPRWRRTRSRYSQRQASGKSQG